MSGEFRRVEERAKFILAQGWLSREVLRSLLLELQNQPGLNMDALLISRQLLSPEQVARIPSLPHSQDHSRRPPSQRSPRRRTKTARLSAVPNPKSAEEPIRVSPERLRVSSTQDGPILGMAPSPSKDGPQPGDDFGDYKILTSVGQGAMGLVFKAIHKPSGDKVALKLMLDAEPDPDDVKRFQKEIQTLIQLKHPNIIEILDFGEIDGHLFFAMEYLVGYDLEEMVDKAIDKSSLPPPWTKILPYIVDIAEALDECHESGVLHRDVKPRNIFIDTKNNRGVLLDFGLMRKDRSRLSASASSAQGLTMTGEMVGTPAFMGPEQFSHGGVFGDPSPYSDVWGIGASLFYGLTGLPPFNQPNAADIYQAITTELPPYPSSLNADVPDWLDELCCATMAREPNQRIPMKKLIKKMRAEGKRQIPFLAIAGILVLISISGLLISHFNQPTHALKIIELTAKKTMTRERGIKISGRISEENQIVELGEFKIESGPNGRFEQVIPLTHGANIILVKTRGAEQSIIVHQDSVPPKLSYLNPTINLAKENAIAYQLDEGWILRGRIRDLYPLSINCSEMIAEPDENGFFELKFPPFQSLNAYVEFSITALDKAGNQHTDTILIMPPPAKVAVSKGPKSPRNKALKKQSNDVVQNYVYQMSKNEDEERLWKLLCDTQRWQSANPGRQDQAIALCISRLKNSFTYVETKLFQCGEVKNRIAIFKHQKTDALFHLIPGQVRDVSWYVNPDFEFVVEYLKVLASQDINDDILKATLLNPPYQGLKQAVCQEFQISIREERNETRMKREYDSTYITDQLKKVINSRTRLKKLFNKHYRYYKMQGKKSESREFVKPFLMARQECTKALWSKAYSKSSVTNDQRPQYRLEYQQVQQWLKKINGLSGQLRLPSQFEWQHACDAGAYTTFYWGDELSGFKDYVWSAQSSKSPRSVEDHEKKWNAFGLTDIIGNAEEWAESDWTLWEKKRPKDPISEYQLERIKEKRPVMGGSTFWPDQFCRSSLFHYKQSEGIWGVCGFRLAASIP